MKNRFLEELDNTIGRALQAEGFVGGAGEWKRLNDPVINCLEIQSSNDQSSCSVNLGVHFVFLPVVGGSSSIEFSSISQPDCEIQKRLTWNEESDHWWAYDSPEKSSEDIAACYQECGRPFFEKFESFPEPFVTIQPLDLEDANLTLFPMMTKVRKVLLLARVHDFLGNAELSMKFCEFGKEVAGRAVGPKAAFREILRKYKS